MRLADEVAEKKRSKRVHAIYDRIFKRLMSLSLTVPTLSVRARRCLPRRFTKAASAA